MKLRIKNSLNRFGLMFLVLVAAIVWTTGCATHPDPLAGGSWKIAFKHEPDQAIEKDCQDYIQKLPPEKRKNVAYVEFFEDGTGRHAVKITITLNGTNWRHILIYDKDDKRIKTIKYISGYSAS